MKKLFIVLLVVSLVSTGLSAPSSMAAASEPGSVYAESMQRMMDLGIFSPTSPDKMDLNNAITREQLAVVIIMLNGHEEKVALYKNAGLFSDVPASRWSAGYVGAAVKLGYMSAKADGLFHPTSPVSFGEVAALFGDLLRYDDYNLTGSYPHNYLNLLSSLGILDGISYSASASVTRGQIALMIDRLFQTKIFGGAQLFVDTVSIYKNVVILENSVINRDSDERRVLTDAGVYYLDPSLKVPQAGKQYVARMKNGQIVKMALADMDFDEISVRYALSGKIIDNAGRTRYLPSNLKYYYHGALSSFEVLNANMKTNSSLVVGTRSDGTGYAVLFDPIYSEPRVITPGMTPSMLERLYGGKTIDRGGKYISPSQIERDDIVYEVTDIWGENAYVIIYSNSVSGEVTAILPNKISPKTIQVDGVNYALSADFPIEKIIGQGGVEVDQTVRLLLSGDGQAIDVIPGGDSDNLNYALVLNAYDRKSTDSEDFGVNKHYVTLLQADGARKTYWIGKDAVALKGKLVLYEVVEHGKDKDDDDVVELTEIEYGNVRVSSINKENRMIDNSTVTNDVVIFNMINNVFGKDSEASILKWADLPDGNLQPDKVLYLHKTGDFDDVDVILFNNILDQGMGYGMVTNISSSFFPGMGAVYNAEILINGVPHMYQYSDGGLYVGQVLRVRMSGGNVIEVDRTVNPVVTDNIVDAIDSSRIRIKGITYNYRSDVSVLKIKDGRWERVGTSEIVKGSNSRRISLYLDKPLNYGGKVVLIVIN
jgi:hypothetical protein